jgi:hypothetical protein
VCLRCRLASMGREIILLLICCLVATQAQTRRRLAMESGGFGVCDLEKKRAMLQQLVLLKDAIVIC